MQRTDIETLISALGATADVMGTQLQSTALRMMAEDLSEYDVKDVLTALRRCRQELSRRLTLADIIERIESRDGMPGPEEAWAVMSRGEDETMVITEQMAEAMQFARPLLNDGDHIAARMAFKDSYARIVREARENRIKPKWFVSLGHDKQGRAQPVSDAIRAGKVGIDHAISLMGPDEKAEVLQLTGNNNHPFLLQYKQAQIEEQKPIDKQTGLKRIAEIKLALRKSA